MSEDIQYPLSAKVIGTDPVTFDGKDFIWDAENSKWILAS